MTGNDTIYQRFLDGLNQASPGLSEEQISAAYREMMEAAFGKDTKLGRTAMVLGAGAEYELARMEALGHEQKSDPVQPESSVHGAREHLKLACGDFNRQHGLVAIDAKAIAHGADPNSEGIKSAVAYIHTFVQGLGEEFDPEVNKAGTYCNRPPPSP